jgi:hypothetical protein
MKKIILNMLLTGSLCIVSSCNEQKILEEIPLDFYSPENSYVTPEDIESAITHLYAGMRTTLYDGDHTGVNLMDGTDFGRSARPDDMGGAIGDFALINSTYNYASFYWTNLYKIIRDANTILNQIDNVEYKTEADKTAAVGEALFFRAFAYRTLAFIYGGVPIELEQVTEPKRNYVRATREAVYEQCIKDYEEAAQSLPAIDRVKADGRISNAAAYHYLAEMYLAVKQWDKAIDAASKVINDSNFGLMTERFGSRKDHPGDAWWDLFQRNNQNRTSGNTEAIWVCQIEYNVTGGGNYRIERTYGPLYWYITDPDGVPGFIGPTSENLGRCIGFHAPTDYWATAIWESDWNNDIRNNEYNMKRDWIYDNPQSAYFGKSVAENPPNYAIFRERDFYAVQTKISTPGDHPDDLYEDKSTGLLKASGGVTVTDQYVARLAETYLIRAEAYLGKGDKAAAAKDINTVRERANAKPVAADDVTIDYILDERLRELAFEEKRRLTLSRLGMLYERTKKYNTHIDAVNIQPYNELYPIPYTEIERNTEAVLEQNPGYN